MTVALSLGSNLGRSEAALRFAVGQLRRVLESARVASLYRSRPHSPIPQPSYLNTAVVGLCRLAAEDLLALAKALEIEAGRHPGPRLGPRPLDVDLVLHGERQSAAAELTLPHPRLRARRFMLAPLAEIAPELAVPPGQATVADLLAALGEEDPIELLAWSAPGPP